MNVQPHSPELFRQGELPGPTLLMGVLRGQQTTEQAKVAMAPVSDAKKLKQRARRGLPV